MASIEYDSNDLLHSEEEYTLAYGGNNNVVEITAFVPYSEITTKTYYHFDANNRLIRSEYDHDLDGGIDSSIGYEYNSEGNLSDKTEYGSDGSVVLQSTFGYTATTAPVFNQSLFELKYFPQPRHFSESLLATFLNSE
ncbi:MAG: hypothetical protein AB8B64_22385 [Granulosicoccus sp.]